MFSYKTKPRYLILIFILLCTKFNKTEGQGE